MDIINFLISLLVLLLQLAYLAGIIYSIVDISKRPVPAKVAWVFAIIFFPFGWAIYLLFKPKLPDPVSAVSETLPPPQTLANQTAGSVQVESQPASTPVGFNINQQINTQNSNSLNVFRVIGIVLAVVTMLAGLAIVGFVILVMIALSSYGSNK